MAETALAAPKQTLFDIAETLEDLFQLQEDAFEDERDAIGAEIQRVVECELATKVDALAWFDRKSDQEVAGLESLIREIETRIGRINRRKMAVRNMTKQAMQRLDVTMLKGQTGTISLRAGSERVAIDDAALLPAEFMRVIPEHSEPNKAAIATALKSKQPVPGARLERGEETIQIR